MKNYSFTEEQIDLFLKGKADSELSHQFHQAMEADPLFKKEMDFLTQSIEGIKAFRINQLKSGLAQIPTPPLQPWYLQPAALWTVGTISSLGLVASIAIMLSDKPGPGPQPAKVSAPTEIVQPSEEPKASTEFTEQTQQAPEDGLTPETNAKKTSSPEPVVNAEEKEVKKRKEPGQPSEQEELNPQFSGADDREVASTPSYTELIIEKAGKYNFHYQLNEGVLTLFLKDQSAPYEVLDIKKGENQGLYLYYLGRYYGLNPTLDQINSLKPVMRKNLIQELEKFRKGE